MNEIIKIKISHLKPTLKVSVYELIKIKKDVPPSPPLVVLHNKFNILVRDDVFQLNQVKRVLLLENAGVDYFEVGSN